MSKINFENNSIIEWVYHVTGVTPNMVQAIEFQRVTPTGLIRAANTHVITLSPEGYHLIRVHYQERHGAPYKVARELPSLTKLPLLWISESGFIDGLPWDSGEWHWQASSQMGDFPFFGYSTKRGYRNARKPTQSTNICSFIQRLNLQNSIVMQVMARIWHNAQPWKVDTLIWLILNQGLPVGTWLQCMGIIPTCKVCT
jgi:hypothetical protein